MGGPKHVDPSTLVEEDEIPNEIPEEIEEVSPLVFPLEEEGEFEEEGE